MDVTYESEGFIEKNRDTVPDEHLENLRSTSNTFLGEVLETSAAVRDRETATAAPKAGNAIAKRSAPKYIGSRALWTLVYQA